MKVQNPILNRVRYFNKYILNRLMRKFADARYGPVAVVRHVGRRSGKPYETPIFAFPITDGFMVVLTYGPEVDWYRNVLAAGQCGLRWHHKDYAIREVEPIDIKMAWRALPVPIRLILRLVGAQHFVRMQYGTAQAANT